MSPVGRPVVLPSPWLWSSPLPEMINADGALWLGMKRCLVQCFDLQRHADTSVRQSFLITSRPQTSHSGWEQSVPITDPEAVYLYFGTADLSLAKTDVCHRWQWHQIWLFQLIGEMTRASEEPRSFSPIPKCDNDEIWFLISERKWQRCCVVVIGGDSGLRRCVSLMKLPFKRGTWRRNVW